MKDMRRRTGQLIDLSSTIGSELPLPSLEIQNKAITVLTNAANEVTPAKSRLTSVSACNRNNPPNASTFDIPPFALLIIVTPAYNSFNDGETLSGSLYISDSNGWWDIEVLKLVVT
jgi:hypothetical protein